MNEDLFISALQVPAASQSAMALTHDFYMAHRLVYSGFSDKEAATAARVLFRFDLEGDVGHLYVQSKRAPDWNRLPEAVRGKMTGPTALVLPDSERLRFRLLAKPSYRIGRKDSPHKGLRTTLSAPAEQLAWLRRKAVEGGFEVEECDLRERVWHDTKTKERLPNGASKPLYGVQFDGILRVTDPDRLRQTVADGIGPQKAYGFGLLSLAPTG